MKVILTVLLAVLLIILLILVTPVGVSLDARPGDVVLYVRVFGIKFKVYPKENNKKCKKYKKNTTDDKTKESGGDKTEAEKKKKQLPNVTFDFILDCISLLSDAITWVVRGVYIPEFILHAILHNDDPAKTAMMYGGACSVLATAMPGLERALRIKKSDIKIYPGFMDENDFELSMTVMAIPIMLVIAAVMVLIRWNKISHKNKAVQQ